MTVPDGFLQTLRESTSLELAVLRHALKQSPEDVDFLRALDQELKRRTTEQTDGTTVRTVRTAE
jgi:hypothetical protein